MTSQEMADQRYMQRALQLASVAQYVAPPNPAVGCVLVKQGNIIGEGSTQRVGGAHAEVQALKAATNAANNTEGSTAYVTLEPCSHTGHTGPCADALIAAGVQRVVAASLDPDPRVSGQGFERLRQSGIAVDAGLLDEQAQAINPGFFCRLQKGRPYVRVKLASSLDGRTAMESGESVWISSDESRRDVQFLRATSDCVLTGSGTVLHDNPSLNVRLSAEELGIVGPVRQPLRAVLDSQLRTPPDAQLFQSGGLVRLYSNAVINNKYNDLNNLVEVIPNLGLDAAGINLKAMLEDLASLPVNLVHVEAGATLCGALLQRSLVDEIVLYLAPHLMGNQGRAQFILPGLEMMSDRIELEVLELSQVGPDIRVRLRPID